jgi:hypothetical protein
MANRDHGRRPDLSVRNYLGKVVLDGGAAKFAERIVVLDSRNVDI